MARAQRQRGRDQKKRRKPILPKGAASLVENVAMIINSEIEKRIDVEFLRRVEDRSQQVALSKLENLKAAEWPEWFRTKVEPQIRENVVSMLRGPWDITCDKCGKSFSTELHPEYVSSLITAGYLTKNFPITMPLELGTKWQDCGYLSDNEARKPLGDDRLYIFPAIENR